MSSERQYMPDLPQGGGDYRACVMGVFGGSRCLVLQSTQPTKKSNPRRGYFEAFLGGKK
jgi:hypothetical protein